MGHCLDSYIYMHRHAEMLKAVENAEDEDERAALQEKADKEMVRAIRFHEKPRTPMEGPSRAVDRNLKRRMGSDANVLDHVKVRHYVPLCRPQKTVPPPLPVATPAPAPNPSEDQTPRRKKKARSDPGMERESESIKCERCGVVGRFRVCQKQATQSCEGCGDVQPWQSTAVEALDLLWQDTSYSKGGSYSYKRQNHLYSWILRIQAKESTEVPEEDMEALRAELAKMQLDVKDPLKVTPDRVRAMLKKLKLPKHYNSVHLIRFMLCGHRPPQMTEAQEREVMSMFDDVVDIYTALQKRGVVKRSNMLSYSYMLLKMLELLGEEYEKFLPQLTLLKHRERLRDQENIWRQVCEASGEFLEQPFEFCPTTQV